MDNTCGFRCGHAFGNRPGTNLFNSRREIRLQIQQFESGFNQPVNPWLLQADLFQKKHFFLVGFQLGNIRFKSYRQYDNFCILVFYRLTHLLHIGIAIFSG